MVLEESIKKEKKSILQKELNAKEVLAALSVVAVIGAYGYLAIYPKYTEYKSAVNTLDGINAQITEYENKMTKMPELQEKLDNLKREVKIKSRILSHNMEDGMFFIGLSKVMNGVSVDLVDYSVDEVVPYETFYALPTSITVRGDYRHIREIMYYLEGQKNMTQILDYSMETHIPEAETNNTQNNINTSQIIVPDSIVYWTNIGSAYHKETCSVLDTEKLSGGELSLPGEPTVSGKTAACQVCKPYSQSSITQDQIENQKPKANGEIEANFKFIIYSSENPMLELDNDDSNKWKPGKYNPFTSTT